MLPEGDKTKEQLISELVGLRQRIAELEALESERKQAEEALRESEEFRSSLLDNAPNPITVVNPDTSIKYVSPALEKLTGFSSAELIGSKAPYPWWPEEKQQQYTRDFEEAMRRRRYRLERLLQKKSGEQFWVEITSTPVIDDGEFKYFLSNWVNITERKLAEEALRESEAKYRGLVSNVKLGVFRSTPEPAGRFLEVNPAMVEITGYSRKELLQMNVSDLYVHLEERESILEKIASGKGKAAEEVRLRKKDGTEIVVLDRKVAVRDNAGEIMYFDGILEDITEDKRAEEQIRKLQERFSGIYNASKDAIGFANLHGILLDVNDSFCRLTGYSKEELLTGKTYQDITPEEYHEYEAKIVEKIVRTGKSAEYEKEYIRKDGSRVPILLTTFVVKGSDGKPIGVAAIIKDITERKEVEEREKQLQEELNRSSRLAAIGELAAGVAHELNNPLTGILGFSERLLRKSTDEKVSQDLESIYNEALRAARVVENLLTFARRREPVKEYSDINDILQEALELRAYELKTSNIEVVLDLAPSLPGVMADFGQIQQVFLNIILNAEQTMTEANSGGKLSIKTQETKGYIRVSFSDDGPGIPAEHLNKVFDPFFTTRGHRGGTGLGLSVCHGIVTEHGGKIYAKSKVGKGATFFVELPLMIEKIDEKSFIGKY